MPQTLNTGFTNSTLPKNKGKQIVTGMAPPKGKRKRSSHGYTAGNGRIESEIKGTSSLKRGMYKAYIEEAFQGHIKGNDARYSDLIAQFKDSQNPGQLRHWLEALTNVASQLNHKSHAPLVEAIVGMPWAVLDDGAFVASYVRFVTSLASARPEWLRDVLETSVKGFRYRTAFTVALKNAEKAATNGKMTRRMVYTRIHSLVEVLSSLIPTLAVNLWPLLSRNFPSKREHKAAQVCYVDNLLRLSEYIPGMAEDILGLIVEKALLLDVEIQADPEDYEGDDDDDDNEAALKTKNVSHGKVAFETAHDILDRPAEEDLDSGESDDDSDGSEADFDFDDVDSEVDPESDSEAKRKAENEKTMTTGGLKKLLDKRDKLDAILKVIFDYLAVAHGRSVLRGGLQAETHPSTPLDVTEPQNTHNNNNMFLNHAHNDSTTDLNLSGSLLSLSTKTSFPFGYNLNALPGSSEEKRKAIFNMLLDVFDRVLLKTFKPRSTQFILFYLCSLDEASTDHFTGVLLGRALYEFHASSVTRVAAAGYLASFISRARFVSARMTRKVVSLLCDYLEGHMANVGANEASTEELPVVYAVSQALFYIFCFRWRDLLSEKLESDAPEVDEDSMAISISLESDHDVMLSQNGLMASRWTPHGLDNVVHRLVSSPLNPLRYCSQSVVLQFASVSQKVNFVYCYAVIESNRRLGRSSGRGAEAGILDSFFPFDPLKLPLSKVYVEGLYREWRGDESDESDSDSDDSEDNSEVSEEEEVEEEEESQSLGFTNFSLPRSPHMLRNSLSSSSSSYIKPRTIKLRRTGRNGRVTTHEDDTMSKSFEAMSLSPEHRFR